jgi:glycine reductase
MTRVVHYLNQFFAGLGGEDKAGAPPAVKRGPQGPGRKLQELLGPEFEIVATVYCGDDVAAADGAAIKAVLALIQGERPDVVVAGPAFTSGRYGVACARVAAAAAAAGIPAIASMHADNPGLEESEPSQPPQPSRTVERAIVIGSGANVREMGPSLAQLAAAVKKHARGEALRSADGRIGRAPRKNVVVPRNAAERAVALLLARLAGGDAPAEVELPKFDRVTPAPPVADAGQAVVALLTEGGLVPAGNPDRLESARASRWLRYAITGRGAAAAGAFMSVHGGFSTVHANQDPNRILPLDVAREMEREGAIGTLFGEYFVTTGNGTTVPNARRFGVEWAAELRKAGIQAAILTAT